MLYFERMDQDTTLKEILEIVHFLKDNGATSQEVKDIRTELKAETGGVRAEIHQLSLNVDLKLNTVKSEIMTHVDGFVVLHQKLDTELVALRVKYDRLEGFVKQLARHANIPLE